MRIRASRAARRRIMRSRELQIMRGIAARFPHASRHDRSRISQMLRDRTLAHRRVGILPRNRRASMHQRPSNIRCGTHSELAGLIRDNRPARIIASAAGSRSHPPRYDERALHATALLTPARASHQHLRKLQMTRMKRLAERRSRTLARLRRQRRRRVPPPQRCAEALVVAHSINP
jgi:hypothetical protein